MEITLSWDDVVRAANIGIARHISAIINRRKGTHGSDPLKSWQTHIIGALGECVVAKAMNIPWDGNLEDLDAADVGPYQVRATPYWTGHLTVHKDHRDKPWQWFILVVGEPPTFKIAGYMLGIDAMQPRYWGDVKDGKNRPAYFVPQQALTPFGEDYRC